MSFDEGPDAYRRSVMLVIWYKAHTAPLRVLNPLPSFPYLSLSQFPALASALGLTGTSFVDAYNPRARHWEQHTLSTVRVVASEQRILYRLRQSLLEGLEAADCPDLSAEIEAQDQFQVAGAAAYSNKRAADAPPDERPPPAKYYAADPYPGPASASTAPPTSATAYDAAFVTPKTNPDEDKEYLYDTSLYSAVAQTSPPPSSQPLPPPPQTPGSGNPPTPAASPLHVPIPYHPHPPLKRWPNDYTVAEIAAGFDGMDALIAATPTLTQRAAFERVFGCRYVKSTVCRHRGVWRRAEHATRASFVALGRSEQAVWGEFVRRVEGRASALAERAGASGAPSPATPGAAGSPGTLHFARMPSPPKASSRGPSPAHAVPVASGARAIVPVPVGAETHRRALSSSGAPTALYEVQPAREA